MSFSKPKRTIFEAEHEAFRSTVRHFLESEAKPRFDQWLSDGVIDRTFWQEAAALGLVGFAAPVEFGGVGITDFRYNAILNEEVVYSGVYVLRVAATGPLGRVDLTQTIRVRHVAATAPNGSVQAPAQSRTTRRAG